MGIDAEAEGGERIESGALALRPVVAFDEQEVGVELQAAIGDDRGFECAQGSGGGVARIDGGRKALLLLLLVQAQEGCFGHDHFAADFECLREAELLQLSAEDGQRHTADGADVGGDVFAGLAIAAGDAGREARAAVGGLVTQRHAQAVELVFGDVLDRQTAGQFAQRASQAASSSAE